MGAAKPWNSLPTGQPENHSEPAHPRGRQGLGTPLPPKRDPSSRSQPVEAGPPSSQDNSTPTSQAVWLFMLPMKHRPVRPSLPAPTR